MLALLGALHHYLAVIKMYANKIQQARIAESVSRWYEMNATKLSKKCSNPARNFSISVLLNNGGIKSPIESVMFLISGENSGTTREAIKTD